MNIVRNLFFAGLVAVPGLAFAAAPVLKVSKSVVIHAPPAVVWAKVSNFDGINTWHPAVAKDQIIAGTNNTVGAERLLTLGDGGTIHEKLLGFDAKHHRFHYEIVESVLPLSAYASTLSVVAVGKGQSKVTWSGTFKRKDTGAHPAADANDATAEKAVAGIYQSGLDNLKKIIETK